MRQAKDFIVFPLDVPSKDEALRLAGLLKGRVGMFKVGLELFIQEGPGIVEAVRSAGGAKIFLDLKLHDIPETVFKAMGRVAALGADFATVHFGESRRMAKAAVRGADGRVGVLGVTALTSVSDEDLRAAGLPDASALVLERAGEFHKAGCAGVVCSALEVKKVKEAFGKGFQAVTPGIRPGWEGVSRGDQKRVATPFDAVRDGSDHLVIGRPIRDARDPGRAADRVAEEIGRALG
ncbi:Orotidine 5'-phosphate decarboxylase [Candidatus Desulfarcum epimagneticum]|uniref:Orotidine 5'-phosphate decarboxylase n=1 Tax=uncultured Desulfobacteraceae bacterium TaxID=218296 RepID=A0A484HL02_9BACT|nr:Orotidine 5'-phosphate decarboxylase [uncultured Desulfobacteraceae bacterium]